MKKIISFALVCLACLCGHTVSAQNAPAATIGLNPMEKVVCAVDSDYCIVRNDEGRRNVFTVRHRATLQLAFDTKFEKYLNTFVLDGKPFIAAASWNPAFGYLWNAWVREGETWKPLLKGFYTDLVILQEEGKPARLQCKDQDGNAQTFTLAELGMDNRVN